MNVILMKLQPEKNYSVFWKNKLMTVIINKTFVKDVKKIQDQKILQKILKKKY